MKEKVLFHLCELCFNLYQIPLTILKEDNLIYSSLSNLELSAFPLLFKDLFNQEKEFEIIQLDKMILMAKMKEEQKELYIGPILCETVHRQRIKDTLLQYSIELKFIDKIIDYLFYQAPKNKADIINIIDYLYTAIYQKVYEGKFEYSKFNNKKSEVFGKIIEDVEVFYSEENAKYVDEMSVLIQQGLVDELKEMFKREQVYPYGQLGPTILRHLKNSCIISTHIVRKAAETGGLDESTSIRLSADYVQRFELATTTQKLNEISREMRMEYCKLVHDLKKIQVNHPLIKKVITYIHHHKIEKLSVKSISKEFNISSNYLCALFKQETKVNLIEYIQKEKIDYAKNLLRYSNYSLAEISEYLSFSSQNYFHLVFKKVTGCTPLEYQSKIKQATD